MKINGNCPKLILLFYSDCRNLKKNVQNLPIMFDYFELFLQLNYVTFIKKSRVVCLQFFCSILEKRKLIKIVNEQTSLKFHFFQFNISDLKVLNLSIAHIVIFSTKIANFMLNLIAFIKTSKRRSFSYESLYFKAHFIVQS